MKHLKLFEEFIFESNLTEAEQEWVKSDEFKSKYGDWEKGQNNTEIILDSKTKEPMKVYHGVKSGMRFDKFEHTTDIGFHFTPNKEVAQGFADISRRRDDMGMVTGSVIYEGFLRTMKGVEGIEDLGNWSTSNFREYLNNLAKEFGIDWTFNKDLCANSRLNRIENLRDLYSKIPGMNGDFDVLMYYNEHEGRFSKGSKWSYIIFDDNQFVRIPNNIKESKLYESKCDIVKLPSGKYITEQDPDSLPFFYIDGKLYIGQYASTHGDIVDKIEEETGEGYAKIRSKTTHRGRLWQKHKIFSYWEYPSKKDFDKIVDDLESKLKIPIWNNGYQIEIEKSKNGDGREWEYNHPDYEKIEAPEIQIETLGEEDGVFLFVKFIPIEWYNKSHKVTSKPKLTLQQRQLMYSEKKRNQ